MLRPIFKILELLTLRNNAGGSRYVNCNYPFIGEIFVRGLDGGLAWSGVLSEWEIKRSNGNKFPGIDSFTV